MGLRESEIRRLSRRDNRTSRAGSRLSFYLSDEQGLNLTADQFGQTQRSFNLSTSELTPGQILQQTRGQGQGLSRSDQIPSVRRFPGPFSAGSLPTASLDRRFPATISQITEVGSPPEFSGTGTIILPSGKDAFRAEIDRASNLRRGESTFTEDSPLILDFEFTSTEGVTETDRRGISVIFQSAERQGVIGWSFIYSRDSLLGLTCRTQTVTQVFGSFVPAVSPSTLATNNSPIAEALVSGASVNIRFTNSSLTVTVSGDLGSFSLASGFPGTNSTPQDQFVLFLSRSFFTGSVDPLEGSVTTITNVKLNSNKVQLRAEP